MNLAFIGLGNMGAPMAARLLEAGHALTVFDAVAHRIDALTALGARAAASVRAAVAGCDVVISMLPSAPHVRAVYLGDEGVVAHARAGTLLIDASTIDPGTARDVAARAAERGCPMADAPVSGGTAGAQAGTLTFMVGADTALFGRVQPVLAGMGRHIVHCGGVGTGQAAKICNNLLLGISMIGVAEAMSLGAAFGIEAGVLAGIINTSSGRCWSCDTYNPVPGVLPQAPAARGYSGGFSTDLMLKDLGLAVDAANRARQPVALGALAQQLYQLWSSRGGAGLDFSSIIRLIESPAS